MSYLKDSEGNVYYEAYENPTQVFTPEEWVIEKDRLIKAYNIQINSLKSQIANIPQPIEIIESYPDDVKIIIQEHNEMFLINNKEDLEEQLIALQTLCAEIEEL